MSINFGNQKRYLDFSNRKLTIRAKMYQHEIGHITGDMVLIVERINKSLAVCEKIISVLGSTKQGFRTRSPFANQSDFEDMLYHMENFIYRLHSYRDKICILINNSLKLGYSESDLGLLNMLLNNGKVKAFHIDTELMKFREGDLSQLLSKRKTMSHSIYYDAYNPLFIPDINPQDVGVYKATLVWRKKINGEVNKINISMGSIFEINEHLTEKLSKYFKSI